MPEPEVSPESEGDVVDYPNGQIDFSPNGRDALDRFVADYRGRMSETARVCATKNGLDIISARHIEDADAIVCKMGLRDGSLGVNPQFWWLSAGMCLAVALAIPDAGALWFGPADSESPHKAWWWLKGIFATLTIIGLTLSGISLLMSLGEFQPKWFLGLRRAASRWVRGR